MVESERIQVANALIMLEEFYERNSYYEDYELAQELLIELSRLALKARDEQAARLLAAETQGEW